MSKFNLPGLNQKVGFDLLNESSKSAGAAFRIVNIPLSDLVIHPLNDEIYPPEDISTLKDMVQNQGLDQNLLVAPMPIAREDAKLLEDTTSTVKAMYPEASEEEFSSLLSEELKRARTLNRCYENNPGKYLVISGNRRCFAYRKLHEEFPDIPIYESVPCKIIDDPEEAEGGYLSRLVTSNSSGRETTDYILLQQYQVLEREFRRQKALGKKLGVKRKYIASALKLSETQVQRLRAINDHLDPQLLQHINTGGLSIAKAAELATLPHNEQISFLETNLEEMIKVSGHLDPQLLQHINTGGLSIAKAAELATLPHNEQISFLETNLEEMIKVSGLDPVPPPDEPAEDPADLSQEDLETLLAYIDNLKDLLANPIAVSATERKKSEKTIKQIESLTRRLYTQIEKYAHNKERL